MTEEVVFDKTKINKILKGFAKKFGDVSIRLGNEIDFRGDVIPTGSLLLDQALGIGGIPLGKIIEIFGEESSGKTTLCSSIIAQAQKKGYLCAFVDAEATYDKDWASRIGVDLENLIFVEPTSLEDGLDKCTYLAEAGVQVIVFDSVAAAPSISEMEGDAGDRNIGEKARILSQYLRAVTQKLRENQSTIIFINQVRTNVGVMYGSPETTPGGKGLKFASSLRLRVSKKAIRTKDTVVGDTVRVRVAKNKLGPPGRWAELTLFFDRGFDIKEEIVQLAIKMELVKKGGPWYTPLFLQKEEGEEIKKFQGADALKAYLEENNHFEELENLVREKILAMNVYSASEDEDDPIDVDDF